MAEKKKANWRRIAGSVLATLVAAGVALAVLAVGAGTFQHVVIGSLVALYGLLRFTGVVLEAKLKKADFDNLSRLALLAKALKADGAAKAFESDLERATEDLDYTWQVKVTGFLVIFAAGVIRAIAAALGL